MSLRIAPSSSHATSTTNTSTSKFTNNNKPTNADRGAPSAPGLPDTLRSSHTINATTSSTAPTSTHPLEARLTQWTQTQETLKHSLLRRNYGLSEPLRRGMELKLVRDADAFRPSALGPPSRVHEEILSGREAEMSWEDVYAGQDGLRLVANAGGDGAGVAWQEEMERKVGIGKW